MQTFVLTIRFLHLTIRALEFQLQLVMYQKTYFKGGKMLGKRKKEQKRLWKMVLKGKSSERKGTILKTCGLHELKGVLYASLMRRVT